MKLSHDELVAAVLYQVAALDGMLLLKADVTANDEADQALIEDDPFGALQLFDDYADGQITSSVIDTLEFDPVTGMQPVIASTGSDVFAIAYRGPNNDGFFITLQIDPTGQIGATVLDSLEFDPNTCQEPSMVTVGSAVFAVVYRGNGSDGYIATINLQ